jgi:hypothetical protein
MSSEFNRISKVQPLIQDLYEACKEKLGFRPDAKIVILRNEDNSANPLGKTAYYDPASHKIGLYTQGRHVKDIMRSLSHELVHHAQNCRGDFAGGLATVDGYAQEDGHLREMEREAYETGNLLFRDWEDNYKRNANNKLFTDTSIMGEKLMEDKEIKLREVIRGLVKEMLVNIKEDGDSSFFDPDREEAEAAETAAQDQEPYKAGVGIGDEDQEMNEGGTYDATDEQCGPPPPSNHPDYQDWERCAMMASQMQVREQKEDTTFFPTTRDIRDKARLQTHEALMKKWGYTKK